MLKGFERSSAATLSIYLEYEVKFCYHLIKIRDHKPVLKLPQIIENLRKEKILCI